MSKGVLKKIDELPTKPGEVIVKEEEKPVLAMKYGKEAFPFNDNIIIKGTAQVKSIMFMENSYEVSFAYEFTLHKLNDYAKEKGLQVGDYLLLKVKADNVIYDKSNAYSARSWYNKFKEDKRDIGEKVREQPTVEVIDFFAVSVHDIICYFR